MFPSQSLESTCQDFASQCRSRVLEISPNFASICIDREVVCEAVWCSEIVSDARLGVSFDCHFFLPNHGPVRYSLDAVG